MSYKLEKPYTDKQRADFVVKYNHNQGLIIEETDTALYALEPDEIMQEGVPVKNPDYETQQLETAKEAKYKEANEGARAYLEGGEALFGVERPMDGGVAVYHVEATDGNIGKLTAYALGFITGQLGAEDVVYWNTKEDVTITLTQEQLSGVLAGLGQVQAQVWNVKFPAYLGQIEAAQTVEEVEGIEIDYSVSRSGAPQEPAQAGDAGAELNISVSRSGALQGFAQAKTVKAELNIAAESSEGEEKISEGAPSGE